MDLTQRVAVKRKKPPAHVSGSTCFCHSFFWSTRRIAHRKPPHAAMPNGKPMPQSTMLVSGKIIAGRFVHCSPGGPPPTPLDSACATARLAVQSGFGVRVKIVVSPDGARKDIGCRTRKVTSEAIPASANIAIVPPKPAVSRVSAFPCSSLSELAMNAATTISTARGARLTREATAMPKDTPNNPYHHHSPFCATRTAQYMVSVTKNTAKLSEVMKCDC